MITLLSLLLGTVVYLIGAGATHGYGKHRWPFHEKYSFAASAYVDNNSDTRIAATILWPFYWIFVWPFTKTNEKVFESIEKHAALQVAKNKTRIADLRATRVELEKSNKEVESAEVELEKEMAKLQ